MNASSIEKAREGLEKELAELQGLILRYSFLSAGFAIVGCGMFIAVRQLTLLPSLAIVVVVPIAVYFLSKRHWTNIHGRHYLDDLKTLAHEPEMAYEFANRAGVFAGQDMFDEAIEDFEIALKLEPDDEDIMYDCAYMLWRQKKDGEAALPLVEKLAKIENDNQGEAYCMKGEILGQTNLQAGLKWIDKALEIDDDAEWAIVKVRLLLKHEAFDAIDQAINEAAQHVRAEGWKSSELATLRGQLAMKRNNFDEAVQFFTQAVKAGGTEDEAEIFTLRAEAYDALGNMDKADADRRYAEKLRG